MPRQPADGQRYDERIVAGEEEVGEDDPDPARPELQIEEGRHSARGGAAQVSCGAGAPAGTPCIRRHQGVRTGMTKNSATTVMTAEIGRRALRHDEALAERAGGLKGSGCRRGRPGDASPHSARPEPADSDSGPGRGSPSRTTSEPRRIRRQRGARGRAPRRGPHDPPRHDTGAADASPARALRAPSSVGRARDRAGPPASCPG